MTDPRVRRLADTHVDFSVSAKEGEKVLIQAANADIPFVNALVDGRLERGDGRFVIPGLEGLNPGRLK